MTTSLTIRALAAVALLIGFYVFALAIVGALLAFVYLDFTRGLHAIKLDVFFGIGALIILAAVLPRIDRFEKPGPRVGEKDHPRLLETIREVAGRTEQDEPAEVYLVPEMNAWVAQRGGWLGVGSRRVMGLGIPLMALLSRRELQAVLAHEFGHYHHGDTKLGPVIHKARSAIGRTIAGLGEHSSLLQKPFEWYGKMFLRITQAISRRQEFVADAVAGRTYGSNALSSALKKLHVEGTAFPLYWAEEVVPVLRSGFAPPLGEGFRRFLEAPAIATQSEAGLEKVMAREERSIYESHPPLRERIQALERISAQPAPSDDRPAFEVLADPEAAERRLLAGMFGQASVDELAPVPWEDVGTRVYVPMWRRLVGRHVELFRGLTPETVFDAVREPAERIGRMRDLLDGVEGDEARHRSLVQVLGMAVTLAFHREGWRVTSGPGEGIVLRKGGATVRPEEVLDRVRRGEAGREEWLELVGRLERRTADLATVADI